MTEGTLLFFIIIIVSAIIIFVFANNLNKVVSKSSRGTSCVTTMTLKTHTSKELVVTTLKGIDEFCPKYQVVFHEKYTDINLKGEKFDKIKYNHLTNNKVNEIIAEEMRYCWHQFGGGKLDAFWFPEPIWGGTVFGGVKDNSVGYRICSEISFDLDKKTIFTGLKDYMKKHDISKKLAKEGMKGTYYDYIANHEQGCGTGEYLKGDNCWEEFAKDDNIRINTSMNINSQDKYLVVFIRKNINKGEGVLNTYFVSEDTIINLAEKAKIVPMPFS